MIWSLIFIVILIPFTSTTVCPGAKPCQHNGLFNNKTCNCSCYSSYAGEYCEFANCKSEPEICINEFGIEKCTQPSIANICPFMCKLPVCKCGFDSCLNGGTFDSNTCQCNCPVMYTGNRCDVLIKVITSTFTSFSTKIKTTTRICLQKLNCINGAQLNDLTCKCECLPSWTGNYCETLVCAKEPLQCKDPFFFTKKDCSLSIIPFYCPVLCGKCQLQLPTTTKTTKTTTIDTTTTTTREKCNTDMCFNGGKIDLTSNSCLCECNPNYTGKFCETLLCDVPEPQVCIYFAINDCLKHFIYYLCPFTCGYCESKKNTTHFSLATTLTTPTTTTTETKFNPLITWYEFQRAFILTNYPLPSFHQYENFVKNAESAGSITTKRELAMFLAQIMWESVGLRYVQEIDCMNTGCPGHYETEDDYPGVRYYGRGYIQLSWAYNYKNASLGLFNDLRLYENPNLVSESDDISWAVSFWYWKEHVHSKPGISEGHFGVSTNAINGFLECNRGLYRQKAPLRFELYKNVLKAFSINGKPLADGC